MSASSGPPEPPFPWRRNLVGIFIAAFVSLLGINFVFPFMPLYVQELGIEDADAAAAWTGNIILVSGLAGVVVAPIWGQVADRRGRKPMLLRALIGAGLALAMMALARGVWELLLYRTLFSVLAGTIPASNSLIAAHTPAHHLGAAMGLLQTAIQASNTGGPVLGGVLAGLVGLRAAFVVTGALYLLGGAIAAAIVRERFRRPVTQHSIARGVARDFRTVLTNPPLRATILVLLLAIGGNNALFPVFPVYIQQTDHPGSATAAAGIAFGAAGLASAVGAVLAGRVLSRTGYRRVVLAGASGTAVLYAIFAVGLPFWPFVVVVGCSGLLQGLMLPALNALVALRSPRGGEGGTFGVVSAFQSLGFSVFPFLGGHIVQLLGLRAVFLFSAGLLACTLAAAWRLIHDERAH